LFGTESGLGNVLHLTDIPVIIHIQGLVNPYLSAWFPKGINQTTLYLNSSLLDILIKKGILENYYTFKRMAEREVHTISKGKYFFGRTEWDRRTIRIYNRDCEYFHCDELLRPAFFENQWHQNQTSTMKFVTTINPNIYKGIEIILETAFLLRKNNTLKFEWVVVGIEKNSQLVKLIEKIKKKKFEENFVSFIGPKSGNDVIVELLKADIFIHPSHIDNSPNSLCEAMLLGMPVIAGNVGGVSSLVQHNVNGVLFNSHDPFELAGIILEKKDNLSELKKLGDNARETAYKRHNSEIIVPTILKTYKKILSERHSYSDYDAALI
jgi:glycosyltransferase involved in cell wall biosynthesis